MASSPSVPGQEPCACEPSMAIEICFLLQEDVSDVIINVTSVVVVSCQSDQELTFERYLLDKSIYT